MMTQSMPLTPPPLLPNSPAPPTPPFTTPIPSLATEMNTQTRSLHTNLNRLIIARLPLGLPPYTHSTIPYEIGLTAFAELFFAVEEAFDRLPHRTDAPLLKHLTTLLPENLKRRTALQNDLSHLRCRHKPHHDIDRAWRTTIHTLIITSDTHLLQLSHDPNAEDAHFLLAYTWVLYMALFSGGRWMRSQFADAENVFWQAYGTEGHAGARHTGYSFLYFSSTSADQGSDGRGDRENAEETDKDGEDLKQEFKARFADAENLLSPQQRDEVIEEAKAVFRLCTQLVGAIDIKVAEVMSPAHGTTDENAELSHSAHPLFSKDQKILQGDDHRRSDHARLEREPAVVWEAWQVVAIIILAVLMAWKIWRGFVVVGVL